MRRRRPESSVDGKWPAESAAEVALVRRTANGATAEVGAAARRKKTVTVSSSGA